MVHAYDAGAGDGDGFDCLRDGDTLRLEWLLEAAEQEMGVPIGPSKAALTPVGPVVAVAAVAPPAGRMSVIGPAGREQLRISSVDTPTTIEHCLRALFGVAPGDRILLRDGDGCMVPLGPGLVSPSSGPPVYTLEVRPATVVASLAVAARSRTPRASLKQVDLGPQRGRPAPVEGTDHGREREVNVLQQALGDPPACPPTPDSLHGTDSSVSTTCSVDHLQLPNVMPDERHVLREQQSSPAPRLLVRHSVTVQWMSTSALEDEIRFWCRLVRNHGVDMSLTLESPESLAGISGNYKWDSSGRSSPFDTSPQRIDALYESWAQDMPLERHVLQARLAAECGMQLTNEQLDQALARVGGRFRDGGGLMGEGGVPKVVFASLFQRLVLGVLCLSNEVVSEEREVRLLEYGEHNDPIEQELTEQHFLFGGHTRDRDHLPTEVAPRSGPRRTTRWALVETSRSELLMKVGAKFFLHPLATEDMMKAAIEGNTKIDRYRHQYFVSLEVYAVDAASALCEKSDADDLDESRRPSVGSRITRSTISLLATGNPPTRTKEPTARDWLITVINDAEQRTRANLDFLDRFRSDRHAAHKVLLSIRDDLMSHKRQREYQADFLMYSIIDRAAGELKPICNAYGRRLRWMQDQLDAARHALPKSYVNEVLRVHLELQELRSWVGQIRGVVKYLEHDNRQIHTRAVAGDGQVHFGADPQGQGKSMRIFLRRTQDYLDEAMDRMAVLDDLTKKFQNDTERYKSDFMNQALLVLTMATAIFLPAQFLAGVYGMNFQAPDGGPGMPELRWKYGYYIFLIGVGSILSSGCTLVYCCFHCRGRRSCCRRSRRLFNAGFQRQISESEA